MGKKILVTTTPELGTDRKVIEEAVDEDLLGFEEWFRMLGKNGERNDPLARYERSIIKTFLYWKLFEEKKDGT